ncbi:MAG TPA: signal peptidase I [Polyangiaceae bacterium]
MPTSVSDSADEKPADEDSAKKEATEDAKPASEPVAEAKPQTEKPKGKLVSIDPPKITPTVRLIRAIYWLIWFLSVPLLFACVMVWALTPPSGVDQPGLFGWIQSAVREQPVPVGIGCFALMEMALGAVRRRLPLSKWAYPPLRPDLPPRMRGLFERAAALLDEAEQIQELHEKAIVREVSSKERTKLRESLDALRTSMRVQPFDEDGFIDALARADGEVDVRLGKWRKSEAREFVESILVAVGVALLLRTFVIEAFKIPSSSMVPTLLVGDHIFVNKFSYGPAIPYTHARVWTKMPPNRGDVMVFAYPENMEQDFIKRVIALPGDKLETTQDGHPIINGWTVPFCLVGNYAYDDAEMLPPHHEGDLFIEFLGKEAYLVFYDRGRDPQIGHGPWIVPQGQVYVMGDNRNNSHDSRAWYGGVGGGVPYDNIKGRALFVWLSYRDTGVDWKRFGWPVMGRPKAPEGFSQLQPAVDKCLRERPSADKSTPPAHP